MRSPVGIEGLDVAALVDREDRVLDVVENGLQVRGGLLADLARQRLRLVRHEPHGAHDAAALGIDAVVVLADALQERAQSSSPPRARASASCRSSKRLRPTCVGAASLKTGGRDIA